MNRAPWNIAVITGPNHANLSKARGYQDFKNALLYADHVHWIAADALFLSWSFMTVKLLSAQGLPGSDKNGKFIEFPLQGAVGEAYLQFRDELNENKIDDLLICHLDERECLEELQRFLYRDLLQALEASLSKSGLPLAQQVVDAFSPSLVRLLQKKVRSATSDCRVVVNGMKKDVATNTQNDAWNTYRAVYELQRAISKLLLPDVSQLPITDILECRDRFASSLDPMRAELLRLTDDLRELISNSVSTKHIATEAENIVATRVEPVVREAAAKVEERKQKKYRELYTRLATTFGFTGASFVNQTFIANAVKEACETAALVFANPEDESSPVKATAQFVLQVHTFLAERR